MPEYLNMEKSFFSPRELNWDNYVLLILKCKQQIRKTNKVLHVSASNHILSDLHLAGVNAKKLLTDILSQNTSSDCQSQNRNSTKIWSMSWTCSWHATGLLSACLLLDYVSYKAGNSHTSEIWWTLKMVVYVEGGKWCLGPQSLTQKFVPCFLRCEYN